MSDQDLIKASRVVSLQLRRERAAALKQAWVEHSEAFRMLIAEWGNPARRRALAAAELALSKAYQNAADDYRTNSPTWQAMRHAAMYLNYSVGQSEFGDAVRAEARKTRVS